jgi:Zn-dependent protease with chaperone function
MDSGLPVWVSPLLALILIAAATVLAIVASRPVRRDPTGPTLPERLHRWRGQQRFAYALAFAPLALAGAHALWGLPLAWLALQAVSHQVRRKVFGDQWSLAGQAAWNARVFVAGPAFWWIVSLAPLVLVSAGAGSWVALLTGTVLLLWNHYWAPLLLFVLGARPIDPHPDRDAAFGVVLARIRIPRPRLVRAGPRGAVVANAFAVTSIHGDAVLFLDALLARATPDEAAGVLAHEIGHLEDFATRRLGLYAHGACLAAGAMAVALLARWAAAPVSAWVLGVVWFGVAMGSLIARAVRSQARETASDLRAVELCGGDGEALIRALLLLYQTAQAPRRLAPGDEQRASHPGLGRRIRAIRAASGTPPPLIEPRAFAADGLPQAVLFEPHRLAFVTMGEAPDLGDPTGLVQRASQVDAFSYEDLVELRIEAGRSLPAVLVAADRSGRRRRLRVALADVPAMQNSIDAVEQRMTAAPPPRPQAGPLLGRLTALLGLIVLLLPAPVTGVLVPALLACVRPTIALLTALAAGTLAATMLPGAPQSPTRVLALILTAFACLVVVAREARAARAAPKPFAWDGFLIVQAMLIGAVALLYAGAFLALGATDVVRLHVVARSFASAGAAWAALGGFLLAIPRRPFRVGGAFAFVAAAGALAVGSNGFRDRYAPDPLIAAAPELQIDALHGSPARELALRGRWHHLRLSPDAKYVLIAGIPEDAGESARQHVAGFDHFQRTVDAEDAAFLDADTLFVVRTHDGARVLSTEGVRDGVTRWSVTLDANRGEEVEVDASGRWRASEPHPGLRAGGTREGRVGDPAIHAPAGPELVIERQLARTGLNPLSAFVPSLVVTSRLVWRGGAAGPRLLAQTRLRVACASDRLSPHRTCLGIDDHETCVWDVDVATGELKPMAWTPRPMSVTGAGPGILVVWHDGDLLALWRGTARALRIAHGQGCPCAYDAAYAAGWLATLTLDGIDTRVKLYAVTPPAPAITASR